MITRLIDETIKRELAQYSLIGITGPRYVGKTTLAKSVAPHFSYISCREMQPRQKAMRNPAEFLQSILAHHPGAIIDDAEYAPALLNYFASYQAPADKKIIITSSLVHLDGKKLDEFVGTKGKIYTLWPLSIAEREMAHLLPPTLDESIVRGSFPLSQKEDDYASWHAQYVRIYCEQDVRAAKSLHNETIFYRFLELCAQAIGQPVNYSELRRACDITIHTAKAWIELLELTQFIYLLPAHHNPYGKRIIKSPKLYFIEPALACAVLKIETPEQLKQHALREKLMESFIVADFYKQAYAAGRAPNCSFWQDKAKHEIECLLDRAADTLPVEITVHNELHTPSLKRLHYWYKVTKSQEKNGVVVYTGMHEQLSSDGKFINWREAKSLNKDGK